MTPFVVWTFVIIGFVGLVYLYGHYVVGRQDERDDKPPTG